MRHEVTITLRCTIPDDHPFLNLKAIADDVAGSAFAQLEGFTDDHGIRYDNATVSTSVVELPGLGGMISPLAWPQFSIPESHWDERGTDEDPSDRLGCAIHINGVPMHVEAFAVKEDADGVQQYDSPFGEQLLDALHEHDGFPGEPFYTWAIRKGDARRYVVVATPFHD